MATDPNPPVDPDPADPVQPPPDDQRTSLLDGVNAKLATIGAIVAAIVGLNSSLSACSAETVNRYAGFRSAVASEETFWKDRFAEYADVLAVEDQEVRRRKIIGLAALAQHEVPDFEEYQLGLFDRGRARQVAKKRLDAMRSSLHLALQRDQDPDVAEAVRQAADFEKLQTEVLSGRSRELAAEVSRPSPVTPDRDPTLVSQVLGTGPKTGWDIDVFWCAGGTPQEEEQIYNEALGRANLLGKLASANSELAPGVRLGVVRLRPLPVLQQGGFYPTRGSGNRLSANADKGEQEAASAILSVLTRAKRPLVLADNAEDTPFYISAFVCGDPPPATTAAAI